MQTTPKTLSLFSGLLVCCLCMGCSNVNVLRLTSETFSPRSVEEVAILSEAPPTEHIRIAELSETASSRVDTLQRHILKKAAQLGADAVVFSAPHSRSEQRVDYQPVYSPWGYYAPYYYGPGPYGYSRPWGYSYGAFGAFGPFGGYRQYAAIPYSVRVTTLKGVAIRYSGSPGEPTP
ncbi:MAG: hypothetical protein K0S45_1882 [Nitrospira sp.]|jgi:hypothetical protein|nr:hypothetical protein [Nitrospira sp.]